MNNLASQPSTAPSVIDYDEPAEMFANQRGVGLPLFFKRFDSVARAVQFAAEALPRGLINVVVETEYQRFESTSVKAIYDAPGYPLPRPHPGAGPKEKTS
jgi:hypothetical protein